jgi:hypothetical protein
VFTNPRHQCTRATKTCRVALNMFGPTVWNFLHVTNLTPRILSWLLNFGKFVHSFYPLYTEPTPFKSFKYFGTAGMCAFYWNYIEEINCTKFTIGMTSLDKLSMWKVLVNKPNFVHNFFLLYLFIVYLSICTCFGPSSGETTVFMRHFVLAIQCGWMAGSWWWAQGRPKHVEIDKYTKNKLCTKLALFTRLYRDARSTKHKMGKCWLLQYTSQHGAANYFDPLDRKLRSRCNVNTGTITNFIE